MRFFSCSMLRRGALIAALFVFIAGGQAMANPKHGILLVAFGSSVESGELAIKAVEGAVKRAYPQTEVRVAYTSRIIMRKLAREQNRIIDEPAIALAKMAYEGFTHVAVLSTHIIPGAEYQDLEAVVDGFRMMAERGTKAGFQYLGLSTALLADTHDFERVAGALARAYAKEAANGAVLFVGHGSHHFADSAYSALQTALWKISPNFFVGNVEGLITQDVILSYLGKTRVKNVAIAPAMLVAGDHAHNDIAGDESDTWKSVLTKKGYRVTPKLTGLGESKEIQKMLIDKLNAAWGASKP